MRFSEILLQESTTKIQLYKHGVFWTAYEQSSYSIWKKKGYKVNCRFIKNINRFVISLGFPEKALEKWQQENGLFPVRQTGNYRCYSLKETFDEEGFVCWRRKIEKEQCVENLAETIENFPLTEKTPLEAFSFLKKLQDDLKNKK